jgi:hypothetical protein
MPLRASTLLALRLPFIFLSEKLAASTGFC